MWDTLSSAIKTVILGADLIDSNRVFEYAKTQMDNYPCITITPSDVADPNFADTARNQRTYVFSIRVFQERLEIKGATAGQLPEEAAERIMRQLVDNLISLFDADAYLGNTLAGRGFCRPIPSRWGYVGEQVNTRSAEILLECVVIV